MATRYNLQITFGGDESETWDNWEVFALDEIVTKALDGYTSGEISLSDENEAPVNTRVFWSLDAEDE